MEWFYGHHSSIYPIIYMVHTIGITPDIHQLLSQKKSFKTTRKLLPRLAIHKINNRTLKFHDERRKKYLPLWCYSQINVGLTGLHQYLRNLVTNAWKCPPYQGFRGYCGSEITFTTLSHSQVGKMISAVVLHQNHILSCRIADSNWLCGAPRHTGIWEK